MYFSTLENRIYFSKSDKNIADNIQGLFLVNKKDIRSQIYEVEFNDVSEICYAKGLYQGYSPSYFLSLKGIKVKHGFTLDNIKQNSKYGSMLLIINKDNTYLPIFYNSSKIQLNFKMSIDHEGGASFKCARREKIKLKARSDSTTKEIVLQ